MVIGMSIVDQICKQNHDPTFRKAVQDAFSAGRGSQMATIAKQAAEIEQLREFARYIRDNYDCDADAHKYGTPCRCCEARHLLAR